MKTNIPPASRLKKALQIIEAHRKIMSEINSDPQLTEDISSIVLYLQEMTPYQAEHILSQQKRYGNLQKQRKSEEIDRAANMDLNSVERVLDSKNSTRSDLEAIAIGRFQVPKGSLRSLGNIEQLREKIYILVQNEKSHETISNVAKEHGTR